MTEAAEATAPEATTGQAEAAAPAVESVLTGNAPVEATETKEVSQEEVNNFIQSLPEDYRTMATTKGFKSETDVYEAYQNLESKLGKRFDDLTTDEIKQLNQKFGAPETPEGYELVLPDGFEDDGSLGEYATQAHELGISKDQAEKLYDWYMQTQIEGMNMSAAEAEQANIAEVQSLQKEFGTAFEQRVEMANNALREFGGDEVTQVLAQHGLQSNPAIVKMLAEVGKLIQEDRPAEAENTGQFGVTPQEAESKIADLYADAAFMKRYSNPTDPGHAAAVNQLETLYKLKLGQA